jgi:hypothetical protein
MVHTKVRSLFAGYATSPHQSNRQRLDHRQQVHAAMVKHAHSHSTSHQHDVHTFGAPSKRPSF